jgi:endonuclease-3
MKDMFKPAEINEILTRLEETYPEADCALDHIGTFELLVAVALSAQTTDKSVNLVTPVLFEKYPDAVSLASAEEEDVRQILKRVGMYKTKTKNLLAMARKLIEEYDGLVPDTYDELIKLPGVGRKTANVVLSVGFGEQRIAVDTHVFRVSNRIGLVNEKDVLKTEIALMEVIPKERWSKAHHSLIFHGRNCCSAKKPKCESCCIADLCSSKI